jgi:ferredoxin--NADP+ reductase
MDVCPVGAIYPEFDLPDELSDYLEINAGYFETNPIVASAPPDPNRRRLPAERPALSVAIVGSGPAGMYAAAELCDIKGVQVSLFDRLPTPFGLVRAGVAPDHPNTKQISTRFGTVLNKANLSCYFNIEVGRDVSIEDLLEYHHAVIWAGGARSDRRLGIDGEDLPGCVSAREFVAWYNGHPDFADRDFNLAGDRVVVIGNGNVALDVARILAQPVDSLRKTDIADHAIDALAQSRVQQVLVTARRGPEHAAYTTGELSALEHVGGVSLRTLIDEVATASDANDRRNAIIAAASKREQDPDSRSIVLRFGMRPESINGTESVESVTFRRVDGEAETVETSLIIRAIGYRGEPVAGLPFDAVTGTLAHLAGAVCDPVTGDTVVGVYCSGWIKRGATGMIGTNKTDSAETVDAVLRDFGAGRLPDPAKDQEALRQFVMERQPQVVDKEAWSRIDKSERLAGRSARRPRRKLVRIDEMLAAARGGDQT